MKHLILLIFISCNAFGQDNFGNISNYEKYGEYLNQNNNLSLNTLDLAAEMYKQIFSNSDEIERDSSAQLFFDRYLNVMYELNNEISNETNNLNTQAIYELGNYEGDFNTKLEEKGIKQKDYDFYKKLKQYSYKLDSSEGMIYVNIANEKYLINAIGNYLSEKSVKYFAVLCNEFANEAFKDAGIVVSINELVDRMVTWEKIYNSNLYSKAKQNAKDKFVNYLTVLFEGTDNTPAFMYENNRVDKRFVEAYKYLIKKYKYSNTVVIFKEYEKLLKKSGYKKSKQINKFIETKLNSIDDILHEKNNAEY